MNIQAITKTLQRLIQRAVCEGGDASDAPRVNLKQFTDNCVALLGQINNGRERHINIKEINDLIELLPSREAQHFFVLALKHGKFHPGKLSPQNVGDIQAKRNWVQFFETQNSAFEIGSKLDPKISLS